MENQNQTPPNVLMFQNSEMKSRSEKLERLRKHMVEDRTSANTSRADPANDHPLTQTMLIELRNNYLMRKSLKGKSA